ncbi:MAG: thiol reductase thioredoxin [Flavobacterium sp. BFFFF2]|nr:MAG: thiol reductase thioredoxin [Flavobacterium sp. BFFFF2]
MLVELTEDNLAQTLAQNPKTVVQFSASWCGNCRIMKPKFKLMAQEHPELTFVIVDAEQFPESRKLANVSNLPTFASFENGQLKDEVQTNKADILADLVQKFAS